MSTVEVRDCRPMVCDHWEYHPTVIPIPYERECPACGERLAVRAVTV